MTGQNDTPNQSTRKALRWKWVWRYDPGSRWLRVCRVMWERGTPGDGIGYSAKLSLALCPRIWMWAKAPYEATAWAVIVAGVRIAYQRRYGGIHV